MEAGCFRLDTRTCGPMGLIRAVASMSSLLARLAACRRRGSGGPFRHGQAGSRSRAHGDTRAGRPG
eukprot:12839482-Alexandrium_andersonii.AAC.1